MPDKSEEEKQTAELPQFQLVEVPFPNFYVNNVTVSSNVMDFSFTLMERLDTQNATIKARVVMTPLHAKMLLVTLQQNLEKWEAQHGEIALPPRRAVTESTASSTAPAQQPSLSPPVASE
jgi:uncharacterized protein DUF3467